MQKYRLHSEQGKHAGILQKNNEAKWISHKMRKSVFQNKLRKEMAENEKISTYYFIRIDIDIYDRNK